MTDKELLLSIQSQIASHLGCQQPPVIDPEPTKVHDLIIVPPRGNKTPPKGRNWDKWVWPVPQWDGTPAKISDGFKRLAKEGHRQHLGADIMYRNESKRKRNLPEWAPWYHLPSDTIPMLAMGPGTIWFAGETSMGWTVKIDHGTHVGFPLITYYTHMSELFIPEHKEGPGGMEVFPGLQLGYVGNSPKGKDPNHAHIEFWDYSDEGGGPRVQRCLDPNLYLRCFGQVALPQPKVGLVPGDD